MSTEPQEVSANARIAAKQIYYRTHLEDFFAKELRIGTKEIGVELPLVPNPAQVAIVRAAEKQLKRTGKIRQLIFKPRQIGGSTYGSALSWNRLSLFRGVYAFVVAQDKSTVANIFAMQDFFRRRMSPDLARRLKYYTKGSEIVLGEGGEEDPMDSRLFVGESKSIHLGIGRTIHVLHGSEVARWQKEEPIKESLIPACSDAAGTVRIFETTAHFGEGANWFRYMCEAAMAGKSEYEFFFPKWWEQSDYSLPLKKGEKLKLDAEEKYFVKKYGMTHGNLLWRRKKVEELKGDEESFKMSYPTTYEEGWILRDMAAFPRAKIMEMQSGLKPPLKRYKVFPTPDGKSGTLVEHPEGELSVWVAPKTDGIYDIGADVAEGHDDGDWSVAEVIERVTNEQCAEWRGRCIPVDFAWVLNAIGRFYNTAQIAPEITGAGFSTAKELAKNYPNIYIWRKQDTIAAKFTNLFGWETQYRSKQLLVDLAHTRIYYHQARIYSQTLWDELRYFARSYTDSGMRTYAAQQGHDDCVMAWCIALKTSDDENFGQYALVNETKPKSPAPTIDDAWRDAKGLDFWDEKNETLAVDQLPWR